MNGTFTLIGMAALLALLVVAISSSVSFNQEIGGRLKMAAKANSLEIAEENLSAAIAGMERRGMTGGHCYIIYAAPDNDLDIIYRNLVSARDEMRSMAKKKDGTPLETSNVLMKFRESVMSYGTLDLPHGITLYPNQILFLWISIAVATFSLVFAIKLRVE